MRLRGRIFLGFAIALALTSPAHAENRWYVGASGGVYMRDDQSGSETFVNLGTGATSPGTQHESFNLGPIGNVSIGYKLPAHFRIEGEFGFATYKPNKVNPLSSGFPALNGQDFKLVSGGTRDRYTGTLNVFYDFHVRGHFVPYVGVGVGAAYNHNSTGTFQDSSGTKFVQSASIDGHKTSGIALAEAGLNINVNDRWSIVPAYRYLHFFATSNQFGDEAGHVFKIGLRYSF